MTPTYLDPARPRSRTSAVRLTLPREPDARSTPGGSASSAPAGPAAATPSWRRGLDARRQGHGRAGPGRRRAGLAPPDAPRARVARVPRTRCALDSGALGRPRVARRSSRRATASWYPPRSGGRRRSRRTSTTGCRPRSSSPVREAIFAYRPIDRVGQHRAAGLDVHLPSRATRRRPRTTRSSRCTSRRAAPKRLVLQTGTTHYAAYAQLQRGRHPADRRVVPAAPRRRSRSGSTRRPIQAPGHGSMRRCPTASTVREGADEPCTTC